MFSTKCVMDLDKLNLVKLCNGGLALGFSCYGLCLKSDVYFKSGQKWLKNNHFALLA